MNIGDFAIGVSEGANRAINTGLGIQAIKSNQMKMENEAELQPLRKQALEQEWAVNNIKYQETVKEQKRRDTIVPMDNLQSFFDKMPNYSNGLLELAEANKMLVDVGGSKGIKIGDLEHLIKLGDSVYNIGDKVLNWTLTDVNAKAASLQKQILEAKDKDKPALQQELQKINQFRSQIINHKHGNELQINKLLEKHTPESVQKWQETGNVGDLEPISIIIETQKQAALDRRANESNATRLKAAGIRASKPEKPTDKERDYQFYLNQFNEGKKQGLHKDEKPLSPYAFDIWKQSQIAGGKAEATAPWKNTSEEQQATFKRTKQKQSGTQQYKTADDVKSAYKAGRIKEADALKILRQNFGMK